MSPTRIRALLLMGSGSFSVGQGLYLTVSVVYFHSVVRVGTDQLGAILSAAGVLAMIAVLPAGYLADSASTKLVSIGVSCTLALALVAVEAANSYPGLFVAVCLVGVLEKGNSVVRQTMISHLVPPEDRVRVQAWVRTAFNVGFAVGAALASPVLAMNSRPGYRYLLLAAAACYAGTAVFTALLPDPPRSRRESLARAFVAVRDRRFVAVALLSGILGIHVSLLDVALPLWLIERTDAQRSLLGPLIVLNTELTVALQIRLSRSSNTVTGSCRTLQRSAGFCLLACGLFVVSDRTHGAVTTAVLFAAIAMLTLFEIMQSAAAWGLSFALSPVESRGRYLAVFSYGASAQSVVGPLLVTVVILRFGWAGWAAVAAVVLLAVGLMRMLAPALRSTESSLAAVPLTV
jgi:sugar phosphate permease